MANAATIEEILQTAKGFGGDEGYNRWTEILETQGEEAMREQWKAVEKLMTKAANYKPRFKDDLKSDCKCGGCADCLGQ